MSNGRLWQLGYGHQWWNYCSDPGSPCEIMAGLGWGGQRLLAYPDEDLVAVFNSWDIYGKEIQSTATLFLETIIPRLDVE